MPSPAFTLRAVPVATAFLLQAVSASAQTAGPAAATLSTVTVEASADATAEGLAPVFAGGQVARGARAGILGTQDMLDSPFSTTSYTHALIQDQQARSVADVLQNDPSVRVARGFGNFQESYFIRGFIVNSDDIAYNGLYGLLPRQYISSELFERVEVLRGASAFLTGAAPAGGGIGGNINLLPKRAPNEAITQVTAGVSSGSQAYVATDLARRFGPDQSTGIRINAAHRDGGTGVDDERVKLDLLSIGLDWRSRNARLSADIGHQEHRLTDTRPNVAPAATLASIPSAPDSRANFAQPWTYSNERDTFGSVRGEYDISDSITAWAAAGARRGKEANSLATFNLDSAATGAGTQSRFDNTRQDDSRTAEIGLRGKFRTGSVGHEWVAAYSFFDLETRNAYALGFGTGSTLATNLYAPRYYAAPALTFLGNDLSSPAPSSKTRLHSVAIGDTLSFMGDRLQFTLGVRDQTIATQSTTYRTVSSGLVLDPGGVQSGYDESRISPVVGLVFKVRPDVSVYANYIEGLTQGDSAPAQVNGTPVRNVGEQLRPYVSKQKEVGIKYDGGRVGGGIALFSTDKPRSLVDGNGLFVAGGEDRHQGAEITVFGEATKGLRVLGGLTFLDAQQKSTGVAATDGKRVIGTPSVQGSIGVDWDVPGVPGLSLDGRVVATGRTYADAVNTQRVGGWGRLDLGARYVTQMAGKIVTLRARVDNVADRSYWASVGGYPGSGYLVVGNPRTFSLSASVDF